MTFSPLNNQQGNQILTRIVRWLVQSAPGLTEPEKRRSRVLFWLQITLILLIGMVLVLDLLFNTGDNPRDHLYNILMASLMVGLLKAFDLNRKGRYRASTNLTVFLAFIGPWGSLLGDPTVMGGDFVPLTYLVLPVILASILLSVRVTLILAAFQFGLLLCLPYFIPALGSINWVSFMSFIFFVSVLGAVSNFINRQDLKQIDESTHLLQESEARLRELSVRDVMTGLFNRRYLEETLKREILRAERKHLPLGIILLDLDHFKRINDTYGHAAGDAVLRELGPFLKAHIRGSDFACRYGGEEFVLVMPEASLEVARLRAELLCQEANKLKVSYAGMFLETVTFSIGVAAFPEHGSDSSSLLSVVDAAMYRAKNEGRNRVCVAGDEKAAD
ncbi:MAG: GGDEF domain-containing protein [Anaerolineaceae bacterium]